jgi:hypothetical protein
VSDAAFDGPVFVFTGELLGVGDGFRMRCAIGITLNGDGRHGNDRRIDKSLFHIVIFRLALSEIEPPAVIMDCNGDVIRIFERCRASVERGVIEVPFRRG